MPFQRLSVNDLGQRIFFASNQADPTAVPPIVSANNGELFTWHPSYRPNDKLDSIHFRCLNNSPGLVYSFCVVFPNDSRLNPKLAVPFTTVGSLILTEGFRVDVDATLNPEAKVLINMGNVTPIKIYSIRDSNISCQAEITLLYRKG